MTIPQKSGVQRPVGKPQTRRGWIRAVMATVCLLALAEIGARVILGLGAPVLYERVPGAGYRVQPDQHLYRFGQHLDYNAQGLRSGPISPAPAPGATRVLCVGDSITFGGVQTDQTQTYPYDLEAQLDRAGKGRFEVLNASAGGWALSNEEGYLRRYGLYGSQDVVLEVGTNDLFQPFSSGDIVDHHPSYPSRRPISALQEGVVRYLLPLIGVKSALQADPGVDQQASVRQGEENLHTVARIAALVKAQHARLFVLFMQQPAPLEPMDAETVAAKNHLFTELRRLQIPCVAAASQFAAAGGGFLFRDGIHPNSRGNLVMADAVEPLLVHAEERGVSPTQTVLRSTTPVEQKDARP